MEFLALRERRSLLQLLPRTNAEDTMEPLQDSEESQNCQLDQLSFVQGRQKNRAVFSHYEDLFEAKALLLDSYPTCKVCIKHLAWSSWTLASVGQG